MTIVGKIRTQKGATMSTTHTCTCVCSNTMNEITYCPLHAAASEMLSVLQGHLDWLIHIYPQVKTAPNSVQMGITQAIKLTRNAIAKAEGQVHP